MKMKFVGIMFMILLGTPSYVYARGGGSNDFIVTLLIVLVVIAIIFLVLREFFCWYWKINEIVGILSEIRDLLSDNPINRKTKKKSGKKNKVSQEFPIEYSQEEEIVSSEKDVPKNFCYHCGETLSEKLSYCPKCKKQIESE